MNDRPRFSPTAPTRVQAPLLDRLLNADAGGADAARRGPAGSARELRRSVLRDLEALLNARQPFRAVAPHHPQLRTSPLSYGLPDLAAGVFNDPAQRETLRVAVEDAIRRFEPRLTQVRVELVEEDITLRSALRLRIDAVLLADPVHEALECDTAIDVPTATIRLSARRGG